MTRNENAREVASRWSKSHILCLRPLISLICFRRSLSFSCSFPLFHFALLVLFLAPLSAAPAHALALPDVRPLGGR